MRLRELIVDPSSGQYSMSRLCLGGLILTCLFLTVMELVGYKFNNWSSLALIVGSVGGVYGVNTGLRVWRGKVLPKE